MSGGVVSKTYLGCDDKMKQLEDETLVSFVEDMAKGRPTEYHFDDDEVLCFKGRIVVPLSLIHI